MNKTSILRTFIIIVAILAIGGGVSLFLIWTGPETVPEDQAGSARVVQTIPMEPRTKPIWVTVSGSVIPAKKVEIKPQVSGQVVWQNEAVTLGGRVRGNEELIRIDSKDYELALAEVRANLEQARFEREVESGRQVIARREWDELQADLNMEEVNRSLVLREPHLKRAEALMEKAVNDIEVAELQLSRTRIVAPFNAMVVEESVEEGKLVNPSSVICELVGTDEFWIQVTIPFSQLKWIRFPGGNQVGAKVNVALDTGYGTRATWRGSVLRLLSDLDPLGRMARAVISVPDPLGLGEGSDDKLPLLLGSYVEVNIDAGELQNVLEIPRVGLREGNRIWVVGPDNLLQIYDCEILWSFKETLLISNVLKPGDQLVVSDLRVALPDMLVAPHPSSAFPEWFEGSNPES